MKFRVMLSVMLLVVLAFSFSARGAEQVFFYHTDPAGTPQSMTDASGIVVWKTDYKPFGEENSITGSAANNKRFVGKEKDEETGLSYFGARYEDAKSGRFIAVDPVKAVDPRTSKSNEIILANPQRFNSYTYALNNPYRYVDPDGKWALVDDAIFIGGGAALGVVGRGVVDLFTWHRSAPADYIGAAVGGATGGETLLYTANPFIAGAAGGLSGNLTAQGINNYSGAQSGFDVKSAFFDTAFGAATGVISGRPRISGINAGRGSDSQVFKQIVTKFQNGSIDNIKPATAVKMGKGAFYEYAFGQGAAAGAAGSTGYGYLTK